MSELTDYSTGYNMRPALDAVIKSLDINEAMRTIARLSTKQHGDALPRFNDHKLAILLRVLIEASTDGKLGDKTLNTSSLNLCLDIVSSIVESPNSVLGTPVPSGAMSYLHRLAYQRMPDLDKSYIARSLYIYHDIAPKIKSDLGFDFELDFEDQFGLSTADFWQIGYSIYKLSVENPGLLFTLSEMAKSLNLETNKLQNFLNLTACDFNSYRSMLRIPTDQSHFEPYSINPLRKVPIIQITRTEYMIPIPSYLLRRITHGLYYDLIELNRKGFVSLMGQALQGYIGVLLKESLPEKYIEFNEGFWTICDTDTCLIINCITRPFGALSRTTGDPEQIRRDLARPGGLVETVQQLQITINQIKAKTANSPSKLSGMVVALEDFFYGNGPFIRGIVNQELERLGKPKMEDTVLLTHMKAFEALCTASRKTKISIRNIISEMNSSPDHRGMELDAYLRYSTIINLDDQEIDLTPHIIAETQEKYL